MTRRPFDAVLVIVLGGSAAGMAASRQPIDLRLVDPFEIHTYPPRR